MDYEKRYKEALEDMRVIYPNLKGDAKLAVEHAFPELAESEDERIRKEIVGVIQKHYPNTPESYRWISWLEKQKELPFVKDVILGYPGVYFYDGERMHFRGSPVMEEKQKEPHYTKRNTLFDKCVDNCDPEVMKEVSDSVDKMLEPSESEDERIRKDIVALIKFALKDGSAVSPGSNTTKEDALAYLEKIREKSLIPDELVEGYKKCGLSKLVEGAKIVNAINSCYSQNLVLHDTFGYEEGRQTGQNEGVKFVLNNPEKYGLQKPAEWSEEDKNGMFSDIIMAIRAFYKCEREDLVDYVKSLRPSWKPSEEHLSALLAVFNDPNNIGSQTCQLALTDLYEQLKKL